jgi:hypothetical protein
VATLSQNNQLFFFFHSFSRQNLPPSSNSELQWLQRPPGVKSSFKHHLVMSHFNSCADGMKQCKGFKMYRALVSHCRLPAQAAIASSCLSLITNRTRPCRYYSEKHHLCAEGRHGHFPSDCCFSFPAPLFDLKH